MHFLRKHLTSSILLLGISIIVILVLGTGAQTASTVTVRLFNSLGNPLLGGSLRYYDGSWNTAVNNGDGTFTVTTYASSVTYEMTYAGAGQTKSGIPSTTNPVDFQTLNVQVQLKNSAGSFIDQGAIQYYAGTWMDFGSTSGGTAARELLPYNYKFRMTYASASQEKYQNVGNDPIVLFQTVNVAVQLQNSAGSLMDQGAVQYYAGTWIDFGMTSGGQVTKELLPYNYKFRMTYAYAANEKYQDVGTNPTVIFQTRNVAVQLQSSTTALMDTGTVQYYSGAWYSFGTTTGGQVTKELLPYNYKFRITYAYASNEKYQDVTSNPTVIFQTKNVAVKLQSSTSAALDTGKVMYYAGAWKDFGTTSGGQANRELLPYNYKFRMTYAYASNEKYQDVTANPNVVFQTQNVLVQLKNSSGQLMDPGSVQYYAGAWKNFGVTSGGQVQKELLPYNYKFRMTYANAANEKYQDTGVNPIVEFPSILATVQVLNLQGQPVNGAVVKYYSGAWYDFGTTANGTVSKQLLPNNYKIRITYDNITEEKWQDLSVQPTVPFQIDVPPPPVLIALEVYDPWDNFITESDSILVNGRVNDSLAVITINSEMASVQTSGMFRKKVAIAEGSNTIIVFASNTGSSDTITRTVTRNVPVLPPDPVAIAPAVDSTVVTTMASATSFLYSGENPIQTGVDIAVMEPVRTAIIRGKVYNRNSMPLPGVHINILGHEEFGQTMSRDDGWFDMAVNGGECLIVNYVKPGFLNVQRQAEMKWQEYTVLDSVVMSELDSSVNIINLSDTTIQIAQGSRISDERGERQAIVFFEPGTQAEMVMPDGTVQLLADIHVRATELTVGENGIIAMPAALPPNVAYTYCVDLTIDEAVQAGAQEVHFNNPLPFYVSNFIGFEAGTQVPVGYYDTRKGVWVPSDNGLVINIVGETDGKADIDMNGDGIADPMDSLSVIGMTIGECEQLADIFDADTSLWRVELPHFSTVDLNWGWAVDPNANKPGQSKPEKTRNEKNPCGKTGNSTIRVQNQTLEEDIPITGSEMVLHYETDRVQGFFTTLDIPLTRPNKYGPLPGSCLGVKLKVEIAGRTFNYQFPPIRDMVYRFVWDRKDAYGRTVYGVQPVKISIGHIYPMLYSNAGARGRAFTKFGSMAVSSSRYPPPPITIWQNYDDKIGIVETNRNFLGGWTLSSHHVYDPAGRSVTLGSGGTYDARDLDNIAITEYSFPGFQFNGIEFTPDGTLFLSTITRIYKVSDARTLEVVAGTGITGFSGDGGPATLAKIQPVDITIGPDQCLYILDGGNNRIRKVDENGIITTIAGETTAGFSGDDGPAILSRIHSHYGGIDFGPDGSLYFADSQNNRIRKISPDGYITTVAGSGLTKWGSYYQDGVKATDASLELPRDVKVSNDGEIYTICPDDVNMDRMWKVDFQGKIQVVAGTVGYPGFQEGVQATTTRLFEPRRMELAPDGSFYVIDADKRSVRKIGSDGIINNFAGDGQNLTLGDSGPSKKASLSTPFDIALHPDGCLFIAEGNGTIRKIGPAYPAFSNGEIAVASEDGNEYYVFSASGRHLTTVDALTSKVKYRFEYDARGLLVSVTDMDSLRTIIERDSSGAPLAIVSPFGQKTLLAQNENGYLSKIENPQGETVRFTYTDLGLMTGMQDPKGFQRVYTYDSTAALVKDIDPVGGFSQLSDSTFIRGSETVLKTAEDAISKYKIEKFANLSVRYTNTNPSNQSIVTLVNKDGYSQTTYPDGTVTTQQTAPDPRFGMQSPIISKATVRTPSGVLFESGHSRRITEITGLTVTGVTDTFNVNGKKTLVSWDGVNRRFTAISPSGRVSCTYLDEKGRVIQDSIPGMLSTHYIYDDQGFLTQARQGDRITTFGYNAQGKLESITDPMNRTATMEYDSVGRVLRQTLTDGRMIDYSYDANGNLTTLTPPGKPGHAFSHTPVNLTRSYYPPLLPDTTGNTYFFYNLDRQIVQTLFSDSSSIQVAYDSTGCGCGGVGKPATITYDRGIVKFKYDPAKGNLTQIISPTLDTLKYTYDGSLPMSVAWKGAVNGSVGVSYNNDFQVTSQTVNGGNSVSYGYDNDGLLTSAGSMTVSRNAQNGLMTGTALGNVTTGYSYASTGELSEYSAQYNGSDLFRTKYNYDKVGRIDTLWETALGIQKKFVYYYDLAGRLERVERNDTTLSVYHYDANGNRLSHVTQRDSVTGVYDDQDRMLSYGNATFGYTATGSLRWKAENGDTTRYDYDLMGNLVSVNMPDGTLIQYLIDGQNRRVGKVANGKVVKRWVYQNQLNIVAELDSLGNVESRFVYGTTKHVPDYMIKNGIIYRLISDYLGSVRFVVDVASGSVAQYISYDEFGNILTDNNPGFQPFSYIGGINDNILGLTRFGVRDYSSFIGRWVQKDPIGFLGNQSNIYCYVFNDPINYLDYTGLFYIFIEEYGTKGGSTFNAIITVIADDGQYATVTGSSWPNPSNGNPGVKDGYYPSTYNPKGHHGKDPAVLVRDGLKVPTIGPNPQQKYHSYADLIEIHKSWSETWRGSTGCFTIKKGQEDDVWDILKPGEKGYVVVVRYQNKKYPCPD